MPSQAPRIILFLAIVVILANSCQTKDGDTSDSVSLTVRVTGQGTVSPGGGNYEAGTVVTLTATPAAGNELSSWRGTDNDASTATTNTVTMTADKTVEVAFISLAVEDFESASAAADWTFMTFSSMLLRFAAPGDSSVQFFDMYGQPVSSVKTENGYCFFSLEGDDGPVYVRN
jgi:hypothetical protein